MASQQIGSSPPGVETTAYTQPDQAAAQATAVWSNPGVQVGLIFYLKLFSCLIIITFI